EHLVGHPADDGGAADVLGPGRPSARSRAGLADVSGEREHVAVGALEQIAMVELAGVPVDEDEDLARRLDEFGQLGELIGVDTRYLVDLFGRVFRESLLA